MEEDGGGGTAELLMQPEWGANRLNVVLHANGELCSAGPLPERGDYVH